MAHEYAALLSEYNNKGTVGAPEFFNTEDEVTKKVTLFAEWMKTSKCCLVITGAGISTSAGIADFRGPNGIWTKEKEGTSSDSTNSEATVNSFEEVKATLTHDALRILEENGHIAYLISQNVDGIHSRFSFPLDRLAEVHGNVFQKRCNKCRRVEFHATPLKSVGLKPIGQKCLEIPKEKNRCPGEFCDFLLDWEDELPEPEYSTCLKYAKMADLVVCLGTSLQIEPIGSLPLQCKKRGAKIVTVNLQNTRIENKVDLAIHSKVDQVMELLLQNLHLDLTRTLSPKIITHSSRKEVKLASKRKSNIEM